MGTAYKNDELNANILGRFKKIDDEDGKAKSCCIYHGEKNLIQIIYGLGEPIENEGIIHILNNGKEVDLKDNKNKLLIKSKNNKNKLSFYTRKDTRSRWFLDVVLSEKIKEQNNSKIKEYWEYIKYISNILDRNIPDKILYEIATDVDCMKLIRNKEYWEYRLNLRGFLLYLYGEPFLKRSKSKSKFEISKVISNNLILEIAPFLKDWRYLDEMGFNVISKLKDIAKEFVNHLDIFVVYIKNYLLRQVSERYFTELEFFSSSEFNTPVYLHDWLNNKNLAIEQLMKRKQRLLEYKIFMYQLLKEWTREQLEYINGNC